MEYNRTKLNKMEENDGESTTTGISRFKRIDNSPSLWFERTKITISIWIAKFDC